METPEGSVGRENTRGSPYFTQLVRDLPTFLKAGTIGVGDILASEECVKQSPLAVRSKTELNNSFVLQIASKLAHLVLYSGQLYRLYHPGAAKVYE